MDGTPSGTVPSSPAASLPRAGGMMKITRPSCPFPAVRRQGRGSTSNRGACFSLPWTCVWAPALSSWAQSKVSGSSLHLTFPPLPHQAAPTIPVSYKSWPWMAFWHTKAVSNSKEIEQETLLKSAVNFIFYMLQLPFCFFFIYYLNTMFYKKDVIVPYCPSGHAGRGSCAW